MERGRGSTAAYRSSSERIRTAYQPPAASVRKKTLAADAPAGATRASMRGKAPVATHETGACTMDSAAGGGVGVAAGAIGAAGAGGGPEARRAARSALSAALTAKPALSAARTWAAASSQRPRPT